MPFLRSLASYYCHNFPLSTRHGRHPSSFQTAAFHLRNLRRKPEMMNREIKANSIKQSQPPASFFNWAKWILGSMLAIAWPFWNKSWQRLLKLEDQIEIAADAVETAAEIVEKVASVAEKVSSDVAEKMPEDGWAKNAALFVEKVAKEAAEESHLTQDIIHKVEVLKEEMEELINPTGRKMHADAEEGCNKKHAE